MTTRPASSFWSARASERKENEVKEILMKRAEKLLTVKSIVTIALTAVFMVLTLRGDITDQSFMNIFLMVITFYFGTQSKKIQKMVDNAEQS